MWRNYFLIKLSIFLLLANAHLLQAQNVGVGTTQPDASAALDISSSDKGLLIPRIDLAVTNISLPATALMVFNTNANYGGGAGIYINMGTSTQPEWTQLVPGNSGNFVRNQTMPQAQSNFNITGNGTIAGRLGIGMSTLPQVPLDLYGGGADMTMLVQSGSPNYTGITMRNSAAISWWTLRQEGINSQLGAFSLTSSTSKVAMRATHNGYVGINQVLDPTEALQVNGNIKASGNVMVDVEYVGQTVTVQGNARQGFYMQCPAGKKIIGGGGGHRDFNAAMNDVTIHYSGPDPDTNGARWRFYVRNTNSDTRTLLLYCICAKVQ